MRGKEKRHEGSGEHSHERSSDTNMCLQHRSNHMSYKEPRYKELSHEKDKTE